MPELSSSGLAGDVARFLGRESQVRGRDRQQARPESLTRAGADSGAAEARPRAAAEGAGRARKPREEWRALEYMPTGADTCAQAARQHRAERWTARRG